jgi:hypothetical protein
MSDSIKHSNRFGDRLRLVCLVVGAIFFLSLYSYGAIEHARRVNLDVSRVDQAAYLSYAQDLYDSNYNVVGGRNRMPVYPFLLSFIYQPDFSENDFFTRSKYFNIALSASLLPAIFWLFRQRLSLIQTLGLWLITTFTVFMFRAGYAQVELLFYFLNFCCFLLLWRMLKQPAWTLAIATGFTLGVTHLTKASIAPAIAIFIFVFLIQQVYSLYCSYQQNRKADRGQQLSLGAIFKKTVLSNLVNLALVVVIFLLTISPYIYTSKRAFGSYFYNVNSTFYIWYNSWAEAENGTRLHGDSKGYPQMPPEEIPSLQKYLREHTAQQIFDRFWNGIDRVFYIAGQSYGYLKYIVLYTSVVVIISLINWQNTMAIARQHWAVLLFLLLYFVSYLLLYAWYVPIASGNRFTLAQFMPVMFFLAAVLSTHQHQLKQSGSKNPFKAIQQKGIMLFYGLLIGMILFELYPILSDRIFILFAGT